MVTASIPEPQSRLSVTPPDTCGRPASRPPCAQGCVVFAGLVGAAEDDVVDLVPIDGQVAVHQRLDRNGGEIVGPDMRQRAAVTADRVRTRRR
jgi:hypothetical protein